MGQGWEQGIGEGFQKFFFRRCKVSLTVNIQYKWYSVKCSDIGVFIGFGEWKVDSKPFGASKCRSPF